LLGQSQVQGLRDQPVDMDGAPERKLRGSTADQFGPAMGQFDDLRRLTKGLGYTHGQHTSLVGRIGVQVPGFTSSETGRHFGGGQPVDPNRYQRSLGQQAAVAGMLVLKDFLGRVAARA
jgi:hypothetical protein